MNPSTYVQQAPDPRGTFYHRQHEAQEPFHHRDRRPHRASPHDGMARAKRNSNPSGTYTAPAASKAAAERAAQAPCRASRIAPERWRYVSKSYVQPSGVPEIRNRMNSKASSRSATSPSTSISGLTRKRAGIFTPTCAARSAATAGAVRPGRGADAFQASA